ncbi:hypothetical protein PRZ48_001231 [Zasmidium cellare]|uniref:Uncharacterized protein n=1 Tax=Zasmidium cellare TaxID=395010 RepID=A0ABR0F0Q6_ZASCE|nr:hypothetical protein PRZ48_001231 [Zasmidium cellare]
MTELDYDEDNEDDYDEDNEDDYDEDDEDDYDESLEWPWEEKEFKDENGILLAVLSTTYGRDAQIFVPLARLKQTTREHLDRLAEENNERPEYPPWLSARWKYDPSVMIDLALPNVTFSQLIATEGWTDKEFTDQIDNSHDVQRFFDARQALGNTIVEALVPRRRREPPPHMGGRRPTPDKDVVIDITTVNPREHRFSIELHHLAPIIGLELPERGEGTPDSVRLIPEFESILVNFSGDLDALRVDQASFEPIAISDAHDMDAIRGTNALIDALNGGEVHGRTDLLNAPGQI